MDRKIIALLILLGGSAHAEAFQESAAACNDSARLYFERSRTDRAEEWVKRAMQMSPSEVDAAWGYVMMGVIKEEEGYLEEALRNYRTGREKAKGLKGPMAGALNGLASIYTTTGEYDSIMAFLEQSRVLDTTAYNRMKTYMTEARYWQTQNAYDKALTALQVAQDNAAKVDEPRSMAIIISNTGGIHFSHSPDQNTAREFYQRSIEACDSSLHANVLARNYGRLANSYMVSGDLEKAESYLKRARKITDISGNLPVRTYVVSSIATLLYEQGKYREAVATMEEPIRIKRELGQLRQLQNDLLNIAEGYMMIKEYGKAQVALDEGMRIGTSLKDIVYLKYFYERAAMLDSITGDYKGAFVNLKRAMVYKDSTFSAQHIRDVREVQEKYEAEQKEKVIAEKELEIEQQKYGQASIIGASVIAVLVLVVILVIIRTRSRAKLLKERELQNQLRLQTIVKTQEDVQQRIARDLHDGLVQVLGAAKMSLQSVTPESDKSVLQKHIRSASDTIDEAINESRSISHQILPYSLLKDGLVPALKELFDRSFPSMEFEHDENVILDNQIMVNIYRIAQELVNNCLKHAEATEVSASIHVAGRELHFIFSDNGRGYNSQKRTHGAGLSNISTRAQLMGGFTIVTSAMGKGTTTELCVPL